MYAQTFASETAALPSTEVAVLRQEILALQMLLKQQNSQFQGISKQMKDHSNVLEEKVETIQERVSLMSAPLDIVASAVASIQNNPAMGRVVRELERFISRDWFNKYSVGGILVVILGLWRYRATVYDRTSEEVAELASRTLRQEGLHRSIQETLDSIVNSPETMKLIQDLLQKVLNDEQTISELLILTSKTLESPEVNKSVLNLVEILLANPELQKQASEFLLLGLDMPTIKVMLENQTQALVRQTVLDLSVQQATATGVKHSIWHMLIPSFLWRMPKPKTGV